MHLSGRFQLLIATTECLFFTLIGCSGTDDGHDGRQAVDVAAVGLDQQAGHGRGLDVMHAAGIAASDHVPCLAFRVIDILFEVDRNSFRAMHLIHRIAQDRQAGLAEQIDLDEAQFLDRVHVVLGHQWAFRRPLHGHEVGQRFGRNDQAARVHRPVARQALEESGHPQDRGKRFFLQRQPAGFRRGRNGPGQVVRRGVRHISCDFVYLVRRQAKHFAQFRHHRAAVEPVRRTDHRHTVVAPSLVHPSHHLIPAVPGQIEVDIRHFAESGPLGIEEAVERQVESERAGMADTQRVADQRIGRGAASQYCDSPASAVFDDLVKDQEVFGVVHLLDDGQLAVEPLEGFRERRAFSADSLLLRLFDVTTTTAGDAQIAEMLGRGPAVGRLERREAILRQIDGHIASLSHLHRVGQGVGAAMEEVFHFGRRPQMPRTLWFVGVRFVKERQCAD